MKKKSLFFIFFLLLGLTLFTLQIIQSDIQDIWQELRNFSIIKFILVLAIGIFNSYLFSLRWEVVAKALFKEKKIPGIAFFLDRLAGYSVSYVTPVAQLGGEPLRIMLIQEEGLPPKVATSSTIIEKALEISATILFLAIGCFLVCLNPEFAEPARSTLIVFSVIMTVLVVLFYYFSFQNKSIFSSALRLLQLHRLKYFRDRLSGLETFEKEMNLFYKQHPRALLAIMLISIATQLVMLLEHFLIAYFMGFRMSFVQTFLVANIPYVAFLMPMPGGIGALESGMAAIFSVSGIPLNPIAFVLILRIRDFLMVIVGFVRSSQKGWKLLKKDYHQDFGI